MTADELNLWRFMGEAVFELIDVFTIIERQVFMVAGNTF